MLNNLKYNKTHSIYFSFSKRPQLPSPNGIISQALEELDDSLDPSKTRFDFASGALLQSTRLLYKTYPSLVRQVYTVKKEVYKEMRERAKEDEEPTTPASGDEPKPAPTSVLDFKVGEAITEDHVQAESDTLKRTRKLIIDETSIAIDDDSTTQ